MSTTFHVLDHLDYVRLRLLRALLALLLASVGGYFLVPLVFPFLLLPESGLTDLVFLSPAEAFFARIKLALCIGLLVGLPFILYQLWALFAPGMNRSQKATGLLLLPVAYGLFVVGCLFAVLYVLPLALRFFLSFGGDGIQPEIAVGNYISFVIGFTLPFGAVFQLPVVILFLTRLGALKPRALARKRKYAVFAIFVVAALVTPADVVSQVMLAVPLLVLFEASLLLARFVAPRGDEAATIPEETDALQ